MLLDQHHRARHRLARRGRTHEVRADRQLLGGEGAQVSDSGLETLLVNLGYDAEQVDAENAQDNARAEKLGLNYTTDTVAPAVDKEDSA